MTDVNIIRFAPRNSEVYRLLIYSGHQLDIKLSDLRGDE